MRHTRPASALLALALVAAAASGRPQAQPDPKPKAADAQKPLAEMIYPKAADPTDAAVAAALATDADVRMARAKIQLAEAELAKARQAATLKVIGLKGKLALLRADVRSAEARCAESARLLQTGVIPQGQLDGERDKLLAAKLALEAAETEWKLLTGSPAGSPAAAAAEFADKLSQPLVLQNESLRAEVADAAVLRALALAMAGRKTAAMTGPIPDRLRAALDKPVKLGAKGEKVTFEKALEVFKKDAGLDVPVRGNYPRVAFYDDKEPGRAVSVPVELVSQGEEMSVGAWFQWLEDNAVVDRNGAVTRHRFYVREYGILLSPTANAPPDAVTLHEFWKRKPEEKK